MISGKIILFRCNFSGRKSSIHIKSGYMKAFLIISLSIFLFAFSCERKDDELFPRKKLSDNGTGNILFIITPGQACLMS